MYRSPLARITVGPADAPTLVLLHGITGSAVSQADAIDHWAELGYRVVALDARGHGLSPRWSSETLAAAGQTLVEDLLMSLNDLADESQGREAIGLTSAPAPVLIGHSMGAATAMVAATRRPDLLAGVVLGDPARYGSRTPEELLVRGAARKRAVAAEVSDPAAAVNRALASSEMPSTEAVVGVWASQRVDSALLSTGVVAPEVPWEEAMAALTVPTLLVTGDRPGSARVGAEGIAVLERIGNPWVETALVPGGAHDVRRSRSDGFYAVVDPWLSRILG